MATRDMKHRLKVVQSIPAGKYTSAQSGAYADTAGYESVTVLLDIGTVTDGTHSAVIEESATGSGSGTTVTTDLLGTFPAGATAGAGGSSSALVGYKGTKRYIRVVSASSGTTGAAYSADIILSDPSFEPTA